MPVVFNIYILICQSCFTTPFCCYNFRLYITYFIMCTCCLGNMGKDGNECPVMCPTKCDESVEMYCNGEMKDGCYMEDFCWPKKGKLL